MSSVVTGASAIERGTASVVEHDGRITGYTTGTGFFGHTVGESNEDVKALIGKPGWAGNLCGTHAIRCGNQVE